jgi:predicted small lipoprotein YifL
MFKIRSGSCFSILSDILKAPQTPRIAKACLRGVMGLSGLGLGLGLALLSGCGQPGPLFLPTDPAAAKRATLPETLNPMRKPSSVVPTPATPAPAPSPASDKTP